ncbi:hypothetical protein NXS19_000086 [Fusarium pseudograminearum]|nr:hypothetical protein NXS19_000086 [Fusarium pseudograminearum]
MSPGVPVDDALVHCPFDEAAQLCHELTIETPGTIRRHSSQKLNVEAKPNKAQAYLPGCPRVPLGMPEVLEYIKKELLTKELDAFEPYLWLVAKQESTHVSSLTEQIVRGRNIIITENPRLHLVWAYDRIFIKPLPEYLLSRAFWDHYLSPQSLPDQELRKDLQQAANGLLRSYAYLIQHKSDFVIAQDEKARLLPAGIDFERFAIFIRDLNIPDSEVSQRFKYGQLRLTRLNFWFKVTFRGFNYAKVEWQYAAYIARYYAPVLFIFAVFSLLLAAMQVILAVQGLDSSDRSSVTAAYREFSQFTLYFVAVVVLLFAMLVVALFLREFTYALNDKLRKKRQV